LLPIEVFEYKNRWKPGYTVEIPNDVFHLCGNCGINPKYTLTITGFVND